MTWRLWFHPESDSLFWDRNWPDCGQCDNVTQERKFRRCAEDRGIETPPDAPLLEVTSISASKPRSSVADAIAKSYKNWSRKPSDLYPTPVDAVESLIPTIKEMRGVEGLPIKRIWEPACGDGRLARVLEYHGYEVISTDLREYPGYGTGGLDFISEHPRDKWGWDLGQIDLIVTNPPFSLAEPFIRRALTLAPNVIMLLKQTYWNTKGRVALFEDHPPSLELKLTWRLAFLEKERGKSPIMDCMWVAWAIGGGQDCVCKPLPKSEYPGYAGTGVRSAVEVLEGEIDALGESIRGLL